MRIGSIVGNIAKDLGLNIKDLTHRKFRITHRASEEYFAVNLENGNLYVKDRIDRESMCGRTTICSVTFEAVVENPLNAFQIKVEIQDINDNSPSFFKNIIDLEIVESTLPGTRFILEKAQDPDVGINSLQNYTISPNIHFALGEMTGNDGNKYPELVLERLLDREQQNTHGLILIASDGGDPIKTGTAVIKIVVTDANDNSPIFSQEIYNVSLKEDAPNNSLVIKVIASDKDEGSYGDITYSFRSIESAAHSIFSIDHTIGEIRNREKLDFEVMKSYEMVVEAKDGGGLVAHCKVVIQIMDANDNVPEIILTSITPHIPEDSLPGTVIALINVLDRDSGENGEVDCEIIGIVHFRLTLYSRGSYKLLTTSAMDRENKSNYKINLLATDKGSPALSTNKTIELEISDVNDNPPIFEKQSYVAYVPENNLPGGSVCSVHASDYDLDQNAQIIYSILNLTILKFPISSFFSINSRTGVIYAQQSFDYEQYKEFEIHIMSKDSGSPPLSTNVTLKVCIVDKNDNAPKILYPSPETDGSSLFEMVPRFSDQGYLVTKVVAVDADSGHNAWLSYNFLQASEQTYFNIGRHTGEIRTSRVLQDKDALKQRVIIMVKDNGSPSLSATVMLNLIVAENVQQAIPELINHSIDMDSQSNLEIYLVIALALISFLFILTVMLSIISRYRKSKSPHAFGVHNTDIYSQVGPGFSSMYNNGTLSLPYSYEVCVALDSSENEFAFLKPNQQVPTERLIDADDSATGSNSVKETLPTGTIQVRSN
ncbi:protocadherin gamma-B2-like [Ascaphus truei]|uniref:protocadherin gamma-B2-like n=1 Tax=Ascaphus truei TaxID=8439 RepID=UPI003F5A4FC8